VIREVYFRASIVFLEKNVADELVSMRKGTQKVASLPAVLVVTGKRPSGRR
jgi:hypothetical protein